MNQFGLFDGEDDKRLLAQHDLYPLPSNDNPTSKYAAASMDPTVTNEQYLAVMVALRHAPEGLTRYEVELATKIRDKIVDARLMKLGAEGLVLKRSDKRRPGRAGKPVEIIAHSCFMGDYPTKRFKQREGSQKVERLTAIIRRLHEADKAMRGINADTPPYRRHVRPIIRELVQEAANG